MSVAQVHAGAPKGPASANISSRRRVRKIGTPRPHGLLVLGMHRSGTSALTRVLSLLGVDLPKKLLGPTPRNPLGFWEWSDAYQLHNEILASIDTRWDDWTPIDSRWFNSVAGRAQARCLGDMLSREFGESTFFVVKDPRACRLAPLWLRAARLARMDLAPILILRHPLEVAGSLAAGKRMNRSQALLVWLRHVLDAEAATRGQRRMMLTYDELLGDWRGAMTRTADRLGFEWPNWDQHAHAEIDAFLDVGQRHHLAQDAVFDGRRGIPNWVRDAYAAMLELCRNGESQSAFETLDAITARFDQAAFVFGPLQSEYLEQADEAGRLRSTIRELEQNGKQARAALAKAGNEATSLRTRLQRREEGLRAVKRELKATRNEETRLRDAFTELRSLFVEARAGAGDAAAALARAGMETKGLKTKLERREEGLRALKRELKAARNEEARLRDAFTELSSLFVETRAGAREAAAALAKAEMETRGLKTKLARREEDLRAVKRRWRAGTIESAKTGDVLEGNCQNKLPSP